MSGSGSVAPPPGGFRRVSITLCATFGTAIYSFTWNSVTVALPHMQGAFSATTDQITWVMIAFVIGSAVMTASIGWFSDRYGRKHLFLLALGGYCVTLVGCAESTTLAQAVAWRFVQGAFGAALIPLGQAIAVNAFPPDRHGQATSLWALGFVTSNVLSPTVAGFIVEHLGWRYIFYVPLPVGIAVVLAGAVLVPRSERVERPMDWIGFTSLILGVGVLQLMLARGERLDWFESPEIIIEATVTALALYVFAIHTATARDPFVDRALFTDRDFVLGQAFIFLIGAVLFLPLLLLPLLLQQIGGYSAIDTGYLLLPRGAGTVISLIIMSRVRDRTDPRPILVVGLLMTAYAAWSMSAWTTEIRPADVMWANFVHGLATGAVWAPLNALTLSHLERRVQNQGFAMFYLAFDIGSAIGTAAIVGLHARHSQANRAYLIEHVNPFSEFGWLGTYPEHWSPERLGGLASLEAEIGRQATMIAYNNSFVVVAVVLAILVPFIPAFRYRGHRRAG